MLQADFPGATGAACPQSPSHLPPDFNALPRELPRLFPSLGLGADRFFFFSPPQQLTQSCSATGKQRSFFFFFFFVQAQSKKKGQTLFWAAQLGTPGRCPGKGTFQAQEADLPSNTKRSSPTRALQLSISRLYYIF